MTPSRGRQRSSLCTAPRDACMGLGLMFIHLLSTLKAKLAILQRTGTSDGDEDAALSNGACGVLCLRGVLCRLGRV